MDCMRNNFSAGVLLDGRFRTVSPLNHGSFGMVFKARDQLSNDFVALKCTTKNSPCGSPVAVDDKSEELLYHRRIGAHPNIVDLVHSFETPHHVYLVIEYCANGDLYEAIRLGRGPLQTEHVRDFMFQLISAVEHMHSKGVYHRDIKPENIFLDARGAMKLGDFGLATTDKWSHEAAVGSDRYMAPEQFDPAGNGYSPALADIWSIGICLLNILFSRNPFATPTASDPLFRDFVADRQSLFDVFPNMSQDTFEVLVHCLAVEPEHRSFASVKEALKRVVSFTTDDESLDDFCTDDVPTPMATANRQPLRTPSITSPHIDQAGAFPWAKALAMSPPQQIRQLSAVMDEFSEPLFPSSEDDDHRDWTTSSKPDSASIASFVDSGLGVSFKTTSTMPREVRRGAGFHERPPITGFAGSLPISAARPIPSMSQVFGKKDFQSKSWSDMLDEEEEAIDSDVENAFPSISGFGARLRAAKSKDWGYESSDGRSTPRNRVGLTELSNPSEVHNSRNRSPENAQSFKTAVDERISEHTGFMFEDQVASTPSAGSWFNSPRKSSLIDKWAKLGARRRNEPVPRSGNTSGSATPKQSKAVPVVTAVKREAEVKTPTTTPRKRSQTRVGSWRGRKQDTWTQHGNKSETWTTDKKDTTRAKSTGANTGREEWLRKNDWRQHSPTLPRDNKYFHLRGGDKSVAANDLERVWKHEIHL